MTSKKFKYDGKSRPVNDIYTTRWFEIFGKKEEEELKAKRSEVFMRKIIIERAVQKKEFLIRRMVNTDKSRSSPCAGSMPCASGVLRRGELGARRQVTRGLVCSRAVRCGGWKFAARCL